MDIFNQQLEIQQKKKRKVEWRSKASNDRPSKLSHFGTKCECKDNAHGLAKKKKLSKHLLNHADTARHAHLSKV